MYTFSDFLRKELNSLNEAKNKPEKKYVPKNHLELTKLVTNKSIYLGDIDIRYVSDLSNLFEHLARDFSGLEEWDVSHVTNMEEMFMHTQFEKGGDISKWDVSNVTNMRRMFEYSNFNGDISKWDVSNVRTMEEMFTHSKFDGDISKWDVSNVKNMEKMFFSSVFKGDLSKWKPTKQAISAPDIFFDSMFSGGKVPFPSWYRGK